MPKPIPQQEFRLHLRMWDPNRQVMEYDPVLVREAIAQGGAGKYFQQWMGHLDDSPQARKIYVGDICDVEVQNEYGSLLPAKAVVGFNTQLAQYLYEVANYPSVFEHCHIKRAVVVGNIYENTGIN